MWRVLGFFVCVVFVVLLFIFNQQTILFVMTNILSKQPFYLSVHRGIIYPSSIQCLE